jgi:hypothetical protein
MSPDSSPAAFTYDVFVSYSPADADWVWEWLTPRLKDAGLRVCTDQESFDVGAPRLLNMENAVANSRHTLLVLTPAYLTSEWALYEQILAQSQDPIGQRRRTLPVLRQPCELPPRIAMLMYADLTGGVNEEREFARVLRTISTAAGAQPASRPPSGQPAPAAAAEPPAAIRRAPPAFNTASLRALLIAAFSDEEFGVFCFDHFPAVHDLFTTGMSRLDRAQRLIEYCVRHGQTEALLTRVKEANRYQYDQFAGRLWTT